MPTPEQITEILKTVQYPGFSRDIVSFGMVTGVAVDAGRAVVDVAITTGDDDVVAELRSRCERAVSSLPGVVAVEVRVDQKRPDAPGAAGGAFAKSELPGVKHIVAIASGKGGVGKSTVAANLACAFRLEGMASGLCDCDIYGPSMGLMFGTTERPLATEDEQIIPIERYGLKLMSMGFLADPETPAILRGPMVTRYTQHFLRGVLWGDLDVLVLDLPPGTGDIQLTIVQTLALSGAVIVTTPQEVALIDARKASGMFAKVNVPILGLIENMSYFQCPGDGKKYYLFGEGGGRKEAKRLSVPLLAELPIDIAAREAGDAGRPIVLADPANPVSQAFRTAAQAIARRLTEKG